MPTTGEGETATTPTRTGSLRIEESLEQDLDELRARIYDLGVTMLRHIRDGRVGRRARR